MNQHRLDQLSDGILAIVMTILVVEIKVPVLFGEVTSLGLWNALTENLDLYLAHLLSFAVLFTYWRGHNYVASVLAKNINNTFAGLNAIFLFFVALIPFSAHLLGSYSNNQVAIAVYAANIVLIGLALFAVRSYAVRSPHIMSNDPDCMEYHRGSIRILFPVVSAALAVAISFYSPIWSIVILTIAIIFNFSKTSAVIVADILGIKC